MYVRYVSLTAIRRETLKAVIPVAASHNVLVVSGDYKTAGGWRDRLIQRFTELPPMSASGCG